ncbi:DUF5926 family protein [Gordonia shandongensis]|uniref:DUF5926 family protein n=1 Tax=Gordonia shandongensis TaxID=376351 RepID=UPI00041E5011|nr:DUF5926 family protein [Gordonia shandongensis]
MGKKSKRGSGPRPGSNRAERVAARKARQAAAAAGPVRPFEGLAAECDLVAMRAFIASATAPVPFASGVDAGRPVEFATVLPGAVAADVRASGGLAALQTDPEPAEPGTALADAITWAAGAGEGETYPAARSGGDTSLADVVDPTAGLEITVHDDFAWWFADDADVPAELAAMLERANATILPTARLRPSSGVGAPWWVDAGDRAHLRWVRPEDEDALMNALARVHADGGLTLGEGSRFAGSFRTHGLVVPVFDLDPDAHHEEWQDGVEAFDAAITAALDDTSDLTAAQRGSRAGIIARQVTLR